MEFTEAEKIAVLDSLRLTVARQMDSKHQDPHAVTALGKVIDSLRGGVDSAGGVVR